MRVVSSGLPSVRVAPFVSSRPQVASFSPAPTLQFGKLLTARTLLLAFALIGGCHVYNDYVKPAKKAYDFIANPFGIFGEDKPPVDTSTWYDGLIPKGPIATREEYSGGRDVEPLSSAPRTRLEEDLKDEAYALMLAHPHSLTEIVDVYNMLHPEQPITEKQLKAACRDQIFDWNSVPKGTMFDLSSLPSR